MVSQQPSSVGRIHFSSILNWHEIPNKNNMTAIGILNYVRKKYKYPAGCLWPRQGSKAKHPRVSGSRPNVRNGHNPRAWVTVSVQNVPKRQPGPGSPASLGLITDFYQRKTQNCTFENHRVFPLSLGAGNGCAAVGGRRGCEGLRWLFIHEGFGAGFALTGAQGFEVCPDAALGMSQLGDVTERVLRWPWLGLRWMRPAMLERSLERQPQESPGALGIAADQAQRALLASLPAT